MGDAVPANESWAYPYNSLRNQAIARARTRLVLLLDVDFLVSMGARERLLARDAWVWALDATYARRQAIVLPAFQTTLNLSLAEGTAVAHDSAAGGKEEGRRPEEQGRGGLGGEGGQHVIAPGDSGEVSCPLPQDCPLAKVPRLCRRRLRARNPGPRLPTRLSPAHHIHLSPSQTCPPLRATAGSKAYMKAEMAAGRITRFAPFFLKGHKYACTVHAME